MKKFDPEHEAGGTISIDSFEKGFMALCIEQSEVSQHIGTVISDLETDLITAYKTRKQPCQVMVKIDNA